ncbi:MAG: hypothetical protein GC154_06770 [bacterium]|nr:hypothetical protein [bacterium]
MKCSICSTMLTFLLTTAWLCVISSPGLTQTLPFASGDLMAGSGNCALCHDNLADQTGADVSIGGQWRSTMMANSARDPFFIAKVSTEIERYPALSSIIQDKCANCHMGLAHVEAQAKGESTLMFGDGFTNPANSYHALAMDGVSCTLCHQIENEGLGEPETFSGHYPIDRETAKPDRIVYGPYGNSLLNPMQSASGYRPEHGEHLTESKLCSTCHTLYTPTVNDEGEIVGEFPEQMVYLEWQHSAFADGGDDDRTCQQCHMPAAPGGVKISSIPPNLSPREPFAQHHFVGGNVFMLRVLRDNADELGVTATTAQFDATINRALSHMENLGAKLVILDASAPAGRLNANLSVTNAAGHKFPAGFPSRRAWIHFQVEDANGAMVFESGRLMDDGSIEGVDSDADETRVEPHYETINSPEQVQVYEASLMDVNGEVTTTLLRAAGYLKDNRLLPRGFDKATAESDIEVAGGARQDADFIGGGDVIRYSVDVSAYAGPFTVRAELMLQSISHPFTRDLRQASTEEARRFMSYYDQQEDSAVICSSAMLERVEKTTAIEDWELYRD